MRSLALSIVVLLVSLVAVARPASATSSELLPFDMPPPDVLQQSPHKVLAHWFLWPLSLDNRNPQAIAPPETYARVQNADAVQYDARLRFRPLARPARFGNDWQVADFAAEIRLAQAMGLDGFLFNYTATGKSGQEGLRKFVLMLQAAEELDTGFTVAPNIDLVGCGKTPTKTCIGTSTYTPEFVAETFLGALERAGQRNSSNLMRHDGKLVVGSFAAEFGPAEWWRGLKREFADRGEEVFIVCVFNATRNQRRMAPFDNACDGWSDFGTISVDHAQRPYDRLWPQTSKLIMGAIRSQDLRSRAKWSKGTESRGSELLRGHWEAAIAHDIDWVHLITWNDHGEHTSHIPTTATQFAFSDLNAYYATWFKTGERPEIRRDALYFFHRIHHGGPWIKQHKGSAPWVNEIEVVAFLTAPADVRIVTVDGVTERSLDAGMQVLRAPLPKRGRPSFEIVRDGQTIVDVTSPFEIGVTPGFGGHGKGVDLVYRAGGSLRMAAGAGRSGEACVSAGPDACLAPDQGEPVWLAR